MKLLVLAVAALFALASLDSAAQTAPFATPIPVQGSLETFSTDGLRIRREQAYVKLLEGQRFVWNTQRLQTQAGKANAMKLARAAFQKAIEFDPTLSEGYTALAELAVGMAPVDIEESIRLATMATTIEPNNFGGRRMLARLYTVKSRVNAGALDQVFAAKAIDEWKYVARLDPRNAEAWAFLSVFSDKKNQPSEHIESLKRWIASASPIDIQFFSRIMGPEASLTPESATVKLAAALIKAGRKDEAVETLSLLIAEDPENAEAVDLLGEAIDSAEGASADVAIQALQQAVFANPANVTLIDLLARLQSRIGRVEDSIKLLKTSADKLKLTNAHATSALFLSLGDLYIEKDRYSEAVEAFERALEARGIVAYVPLAGEDREFAMFAFEKLIQTYKLSDRSGDVKTVIDRSRSVLGKDDLFSDRQLIAFYRSAGKKTEALAAIKSVRERIPNDNGFMRLEASLLAETGRVEAAVAMIKAEISRKVAGSPIVRQRSETGPETIAVPLPAYDEFSNYLFISNLYSKANRGKEAAYAANQAFTAAIGSERKQIAKLTLATAQQMAGDFNGAESTLQEILKQTPGNPIALNNLGYFLVERNERLAEALGLIQQALKVDPKNPSYLDSLGWALFKLGKLDEAEKFLKDASRLDTDSATIHEHLGDVYVKKQNAALAKAAWEKALRLASDSVDIDRLKKKLKN
ncbi:MAG: tetratricopeptide repeat protein [Pyrinomonadaceae bacterium]